jgi:uncharacterized membrane protein SpoIIM required for sporulation
LLDSLHMALVITRREIRDQFRDWRIIFPVVILTLIFPGLMNFTARQAVNFVQRYNAPLIAERMIPFMLMVVGFFPISVSLVIALESFVGEKERRSIEPLLCSPLTDGQLYLGKLLAAMVPPLLGSYLGIIVYLSGLYAGVGWKPPALLLLQILLLTTVQGVLMVSGAVVVSSQTTSVRAANLLASFIIIPMAFLIQGESAIMFWGRYNVLWYVIIGLVVITSLLIRTGVAYFNREEMLGRELDTINLKWGWRRAREGFLGKAHTILAWYKQELPATLRDLRLPIVVSAIAILIGYLAGFDLADQFRLPADLISFHNLQSGFMRSLESMSFFTASGVGSIWLHNLRAVLIATLLGSFSFGVLGLIVLMLPIAIIGFVAGNAAIAGISQASFLVALVLPHGILEIPAMIIAGAAILNLGASLTSPSEGKSLGDAWLLAFGKWAKIMIGVVVPLFLIAALLEVFVTPVIAVWVLGL